MGPIHVFGDSIGQGLYMDEQGNYRLSRRGCVRLLKQSGLPVENHAKHGFTVREGLESFERSGIAGGGLCVIEFTGNDCDLDWDAVSAEPGRFHDGKVPIEEFREKLARFAALAAERGLEPVLVTPPPILSGRYFRHVSQGRSAERILSYLGDDEHISRWQERYANAVRDTALSLGCALADVRGWMLEERDYDALMSPDGIHPNEAGQERLAARFAERCGIALRAGA